MDQSFLCWMQKKYKGLLTDLCIARDIRTFASSLVAIAVLWLSRVMKIPMRAFIPSILLILFAWQLLLKAGVWLWYGFNRSYIASELCENRDKPALKCNGQCVLAKRLQAAEEERRDAQERPLRIIEKIELSHCLPVQLLQLPDFSQASTLQGVWPSLQLPVSDYASSLFHPPRSH